MGIYIFISILVILACVVVIMVVLVHNFTSAGQSMGVRKTADFLEKSTWTLGAAILVLCLAATASIPRGQGEKESVIRSSIERAQDPTAIPTLPSPLTGQEEQPDGGNE
jgi:preprotein translocase subunit SecG